MQKLEANHNHEHREVECCLETRGLTKVSNILGSCAGWDFAQRPTESHGDMVSLGQGGQLRDLRSMGV